MSAISTPDTTLNSETSNPVYRLRKRTALTTWLHARPPKDDEPLRSASNVEIWYCKHCDDYRAMSTTTARRHLDSKHGIQIDVSNKIHELGRQGVDSIYLATGLTRKDYDFDVFKRILHKKAIQEALVRLIVRYDLPFRAVQWPELHTLLQLINPAATVMTSHSTVCRLISSSWDTASDLLRQRLQAALSPIHIAADVWTSPNRYLFLGICAQFVDYEDRRLKKVLLALRPILTHRGFEQASEISQVLQKYSISKKLGYFIGDNATSNDVLCRTLSQSLAQEDIDWNPVQNRLRCYGHVLNLAVQAFFSALDIDISEVDNDKNDTNNDNEDQAYWRSKGPLGKLHNIAVHIRGSPTRSAEFKQLAGRGLPLDNDTRWNSWYSVLVVAQKDIVARAIDSYTKNWQSDLEDDYLTLNDWELLRAITAFLEPFHQVTLETQGSHGMIDEVLFSMDVLVDHYEAARKTTIPQLREKIDKSWEVFDKYYMKTEETPIYVAAIILHPSRRTEYIKTYWPKKWQAPALKSVQQFWEAYREKIDPLTLISNISELDIQPPSVPKTYSVLRQKRNLLEKRRGKQEDEYSLFIKAPITPLGNITALDWWLRQDHQEAYPVLSRFAVMVLSAPAMSDEPERVFSGARRTITWTRMQLGVENIEKTQCLKSWLKSELIQLSYEDDEENMDDEEVEDIEDEALSDEEETPEG